MMSLDEGTWELLLERISGQRCTPFLGAGISAHPTGADIALRWATEYGYPLADASDLTRVAEFIALTRGDAMLPKERLLRLFEQTRAPDYAAPGNPYGLLAELPFEIYITTNYDNFMVEALQARHRNPRRVVCQWNTAVEASDTSQPPTPATPWVFHLHGSDQASESMVLTEEDYLDFLVRFVQREDHMLPHRVVRALSNTTLLFIGYSLGDWTFRILWRCITSSLPNSLQRAHVAVQLSRNATEEAYLAKYFDRDRVKVFWGEADEFVEELRQRWEAHDGRVGSPLPTEQAQ